MALARLGLSALRMLITDYSKQGLTGTTTIATFRKLGGKISNKSFWAEWGEIHFGHIIRDTASALDQSIVPEKSYFGRKARRVGKKWVYRFQVTESDSRGNLSTSFKSIATSRRMTIQTAAGKLSILYEAGISGGGLDFVRATFIGGLERVV